MVIFLYRPEYYKITEDENGMPTTGMGEIIIAKNRNGSLGSVILKFIPKFTKFTDMSESGPYGKFGTQFPSGGSEPDTQNTITLGSKANEDFPDDTTQADDGDSPDDKAPF